MMGSLLGGICSDKIAVVLQFANKWHPMQCNEAVGWMGTQRPGAERWSEGRGAGRAAVKWGPMASHQSTMKQANGMTSHAEVAWFRIGLFRKGFIDPIRREASKSRSFVLLCSLTAGPVSLISKRGYPQTFDLSFWDVWRFYSAYSYAVHHCYQISKDFFVF